MCVVRATEATIKTSSSGDKLKTAQLPTFKKILGRVSPGVDPWFSCGVELKVAS